MHKQISVIIPTLNEENYIEGTISHTLTVAKDPDLLEIIVIDAGSGDSTLERIPDHCSVFTDPSLAGKKYASLNAGIEKSHAEILLFLDADTLLPKHFDEKIRQLMIQDSIVAGAFELTFETRDVKLKFLQFFNQIRYRFDKEYFGDQALFVKRNVLDKVGRFPESSILESAMLCRSLTRKGRLVLIKDPVISSARRFENQFWKTFWFDLRIWIRYKLGLSVDQYGKNYWLEDKS